MLLVMLMLAEIDLLWLMEAVPVAERDEDLDGRWDKEQLFGLESVNVLFALLLVEDVALLDSDVVFDSTNDAVR